MRNILTILFLCLTLSAVAKRSYNWMNTDTDWKRLKLVEQLTVPPAEIDTAMVVASNRLLQRDSLRFLCEDLQKDHLHYLFVYVKNGTWHVLPAPSLQAAINYLPHPDNDWVVYTEGMGKVFTANLDRGLRLGSFYKVNVLMLDYPSIHPNKKTLGNYTFALTNAREAYKDFAPVIDTIKRLRDNELMGKGSLSLFFHSMGNNVMSQLVKHDQLKNVNNEVWVDNIILNAPCVKQRKHSSWIEPINFARNIYVHYNPEDRTLFMAHLASFRKQLGEKVKAPLASKAIYINFNQAAGEGHSIFLPLPNRSAGSPEIFAHYSQLFHGRKITPGDSKNYAPTAYRGIGWDLLPDSRHTAVNQ